MTLKSLTLTNFRQFESLTLAFEKPWSAIIAPNASGKSTILEALYMLSNGESPWEQNHNHIVKLHPEATSEDPAHVKLANCTSRIEAVLTTDDDEHSIALSFSTNNGTTTKQYVVDGKSTTRPRFLSRLHTVLFSPDLIDLLMFEPAQRRTFLDFYASYLYPEMDEIRLNYHKVLRHRNSILKSIAAQRYHSLYGSNGYCSSPQNQSVSSTSQPAAANGNGSMLQYWTSQLIDLGSRVIDFRLQLIEQINDGPQTYPTTIAYLPTIPLNDLSGIASLSHIKDAFFDRIESVKEKEKLAGKTLVGPHRDDWHLSTCGQNINCYGSRGEKRMAIADIIFKLNDIFRAKFTPPPILLLDDISSELDVDNVSLVFKKKLEKEQQTILTSTSIDHIPRHARSAIQIISLK